MEQGELHCIINKLNCAAVICNAHLTPSFEIHCVLEAMVPDMYLSSSHSDLEVKKD